MDFTKLDLGPQVSGRAETVAKIEPKGADGNPVTLSNGEALRFTMLLPSTPEGQREMRKWGMLADNAKAITNPKEATEDELAAEVERQIAAETELAARMVRDWNLVDGHGKPVECSLENRRAFFDHFTVLRSDTVVQMTRKAEALGNEPKP